MEPPPKLQHLGSPEGDGGVESGVQTEDLDRPPPKRPCIFFDKPRGFEWAEGTDSRLLSYKSLDDVPKNLLRTLAINVSRPFALSTWLNSNSASHITQLFIYCPATADAPTPHVWCRLLDRLSQEAINLQDLQVYWDWDFEVRGPTLDGMGKNLSFVRSLGALRPKSLTLCGFYAMHWPTYLGSRMGVSAVNPQTQVTPTWENGWATELRRYQEGTATLIP